MDRKTRRRIRAVLCDADGTLIDSFRQGLHKMHICAERFGFKYDEAFALAHWGMKLDEFLKLCFTGITEEQYKGMIQIFDDLDYELPPTAIEGVEAALNFLAAEGVIFTIVTSRDSTTLAHILKHNSIDHHFKHIATEDTVEFVKPDPRVFDCTVKMLEKRGIDTDECLFIGDTYHDFEAGTRFGFRTVIVKTGPLTEPDALIPEEDHIQSFAELPAWLKRNGLLATDVSQEPA